MANNRLTPLQMRVLRALAGMGWTLTGGGALAGFHLGHRTTRDLDLFFHGWRELGLVPREVRLRLERLGLQVDTLQDAEAFYRFRVSDGAEALPIDLVADPIPTVEPPFEVEAGIQIDTIQEILTNKLTALLSRWEIRDLVDVHALLQAGADLDQALLDAPRKDGGFSPPTLAWVLSTLPTTGLTSEMVTFREELITRLRS